VAPQYTFMLSQNWPRVPVFGPGKQSKASVLAELSQVSPSSTLQGIPVIGLHLLAAAGIWQIEMEL
jgi:hypothetical protein